ncbi:MAG: hypothetical protein KAX46_05530 [Chromatiaceae bacterium]|nr:hypothetical protein [Chromatiaceae bacterium]
MKFLNAKALMGLSSALVIAGSGLLLTDAWADRGGRGGGGGGGGHARTSVNQSVNTNRSANANRSANVNANRNTNVNANRNTNVNANRNVNVNANRNVNVNSHHDVDVNVNRRGYHPVATGVAIGATAAVVGSIIYSLPPSCRSVTVGSVTYRECGGTYYQPRYVGSSVEYVVVNSPY